MPQLYPVNANTMNYAGPIMGGVVLLSGIWYTVYGVSASIYLSKAARLTFYLLKSGEHTDRRRLLSVAWFRGQKRSERRPKLGRRSCLSRRTELAGLLLEIAYFTPRSRKIVRLLVYES